MRWGVPKIFLWIAIFDRVRLPVFAIFCIMQNLFWSFWIIPSKLLSLEKRFLQRHGWNSVHLDFLRADCWLTRGIFSVREFTEKIHEEEQCYPVRFNERPAHYIRILARLTPPPASFSSSSSSSFLPAAFCSLVLSSRLRLQILWKLSFTFCERMKNRVWISSSLQ